MIPKLILDKNEPIESEIILLSLLIGALDVISIDRKAIDYFGDRLFNPYCIDVLESMNISESSMQLLSKALFLEDYESLGFSEEKFQRAVQSLRHELLERLHSFPVRYTQSSKWLTLEDA